MSLPFPDEKMRHEFIHAFLASAGLGWCWSSNGPTGGPSLLRWTLSEKDKPGWLSPRENVLLRVAFDLWNGSGAALFAEVLDLPERWRLLLGFILFAGGGRFAEWLPEIREELFRTEQK